jgi:hypothetical protein
MRRVRSSLNLVLFAAPAGLLCLFAGRSVVRVWNYLNSGPRLAGVFSVEATRALGREVRVRSVIFKSNPWSLLPNRVELRQLSIAGGVGNGNFVQVDGIVIWYDLRQVLLTHDNRVPLVKEVALTRPQVAVFRDARGQWSFAQLIKPSRGTGRPFTARVSFRDGGIAYTDYDLPRPAGTARLPLSLALRALNGVVLIRPDKSVAFDIAGNGDAQLLRDFHAIGVTMPDPLRFTARLIAHDLVVANIGRRLLQPATGRILGGHADVDFSLLYSPVNTTGAHFALSSLDANGVVALNDVTISTPMLGAPLTNLTGTLTLAGDSALGDLTGGLAGARFTVSGRAVDLRPAIVSSARSVSTRSVSTRSVVGPLVTLRGTLTNGDYSKIVHAIHLNRYLSRLPVRIRTNIMNSAGYGNLDVRLVGPLTNPTLAVAGQVAFLRYDRYRGDNVDLRTFYGHHAVDVDARGRFARGDAFVRAHVATDPTGTFQVEAHLRKLQLQALHAMTGLHLGGVGQLDFAIQGENHVMPSITTQGQVNGLSFGGQTLRSVYAYAATVGDPLIRWGQFVTNPQAQKQLRLETLRVDDARGFALGNGTLDLHTQQMNLNLEADELDLGALASAIRNGSAQQSNTAQPLTGRVDLSRQPPAGPMMAQAPDTHAVPNGVFDLNALQGVGYLRAHIGGTLRNPHTSGRFSAFAVQAGKAGLDNVTADFAVDRDTLLLARSVAQRYPGSLTAAGRISGLRSPDPKVDLTARADNIDVGDLLNLSGVLPDTGTISSKTSQYVITGRLSAAPIAVTGTLHDLVLAKPVTVHLEDAAINNLRLPLATVEATYDHAGVHIADARADVAGGTILASGLVGRNLLDLNITGKGLGLQSLATALPETAGTPLAVPATTSVKSLPLHPRDLTGELNFQTHVGGSPRQPQISGTTTVTDLGYRDFVLGTVQATARYADGRISVLDAGLREPGTPSGLPDTLQTDGFAYNLKTKTLGGTLQWNKLRLQRLGDLFTSAALADTALAAQRSPEADTLARDLQGTLSGMLTVGGTLEAPVADITWNAQDIKVKNQVVTAVSGSALVDSRHVEIPSPDHRKMNLRIESPDGTIVGDNMSYAFDRLVDGKVDHGDIAGEINAHNINLGLIHNWLPPRTRQPQPLIDAARQLTGRGDQVDFLVHGKTDSPVIDVSANFTDLGYMGLTIDRINLSHATIAEPQIQIDDIEMTKRFATGDANGSMFIARVNHGKIGFQWKTPFLPKDGLFELDADVPRQDLNALAAFGAATSGNGKQGLFAADTTGFFAAHAHLSRINGKLMPVGALDLVADRLHLESARTGLRDVAAHLDFAGDTVTARGKAQSYIYDSKGSKDNKLPESRRLGSEITLAGSLPLSGLVADANGSAITLNADDIKIDETPIPGTSTPKVKGSGSLRGDVGLNLALRGSFTDPLIAGDINVSNMTLVEPREFGGTAGGTFALPINPAFDVTINLKNNVRLMNSLLNARLDGTGHLTGRLFKKTPDLSALTGADAESEAGDMIDELPPLKAPGGASRGHTLADAETPTPANNIALNFRGDFVVREGRLSLPTARFTLLPPGTQAPGTLAVRYPDFDPSLPGQQVVGVEVDVAAQTFLDLPSYNSISGRARYQVTLVAKGRPVIDPVTGQSKLTLNFQTDPPDFTNNQQALQQSLLGVLGGDSLQGVNRNPGQALTQQLTNVVTGAVIPNIFDRPAAALGFDELAINYDPVQRLNFIISRRILGPLYVTYDRAFGGTYYQYNLKASYRFSQRYQLSYDTDDQNTQRLLLEGVLRF